MKSKYYQDCAETIQRVIFLRNFDLDYCTKHGKTSVRDNHKKFIDKLKSLKNKCEGRTGLINIQQNISESVTESNGSNNSTGPSGTTSGSVPDQTNTNHQGEGSKLTFSEILKRK